jgi:CRISPR-associated endonuclease/helicase Cas3
MECEKLLYHLWAKCDNEGNYHPLVCHMLDVAAVTKYLCESPRCLNISKQISQNVGLDINQTIKWLCFFSALHDLGKACPSFQFLESIPSSIKEGLIEIGLSGKKVDGLYHGLVTAITLESCINDTVPSFDRVTINRLARVLGGHHGVIPIGQELKKGKQKLTVSEYKNEVWIELRKTITRILFELSNNDSSKVFKLSSHDNQTPILLAGLVCVSDWIGSIEQYFSFNPLCNDYYNYWQQSCSKAQHALHDIGWLGWNLPSSKKTFTELFSFEPRSLQQSIIDLEDTSSQIKMVIIESPMGEGKTEAALYLQDLWSIDNGQPGAYFALPTMAASNQLYNRTLKFLGDRYIGHRLNVHLLHSHRLLNKDYDELKTSSIDQDCKDDDGFIVADEWFSKSKRGLLAPFAVGTIDQSLLSILQVKHGFVRLFGLAGKTLIFDEVHAYDAYMMTLFERLLQWLSLLNTTVIILSATLPQSTRKRLLAAYSKHPSTYNDVSYPRITTLSSNHHINALSIPISPERSKNVAIEWIDNDFSNIMNQLNQDICDGGNIVWICNTVNKAQDIYQVLKKEFEDSDVQIYLFHARFPIYRRLQIEEHVLKLFGKDTNHRPYKSILIATQVVEQSLDLDFDLMITEIAPIDLLLQRTGRMHRHHNPNRPENFCNPVLRIIKPDGHNDNNPKLNCYVYDEFILLRSWLTLVNKYQINIPNDFEDLIESVYAECMLDDSHPLHQKEIDLHEKFLKEKQDVEIQGRRFLIQSPHDGDIIMDENLKLDEENPDIHQTLKANTRLAPPSVTIVCLMEESEIEIPSTNEKQYIFSLIKKSISLSYKGCISDFPEDMIPANWKKVSLLRYCRAVILQNSEYKAKNRTIILHEELGIVLRKGDVNDELVQFDY